MKKTLLASAILAGLVSATAQAATVYDQDGAKIDFYGGAEFALVSNDSVDGTVDSDNSGYIGISGSSKVSDTVTAYAEFSVETGTNSTSTDVVDDTGTSTTNKSFDSDEFSSINADDFLIGFDTAYGDFSMGGIDSALEAVGDFTDVAAWEGGEVELIGGEGGSAFAYSNTFGGLTVNGEYIASSDEDADSIGVSAVYTLEFGLNVGAGYATVDDGDETATEAVFGLSYTIGDAYAAVTYGTGEYATGVDFTATEAAVQYTVAGVTFGALMAVVEENDVDTTDYFAFDATYSVNDYVTTYISYKLDNLDNGEDEIVAAVSYDF